MMACQLKQLASALLLNLCRVRLNAVRLCHRQSPLCYFVIVIRVPGVRMLLHDWPGWICVLMCVIKPYRICCHQYAVVVCEMFSHWIAPIVGVLWRTKHVITLYRQQSHVVTRHDVRTNQIPLLSDCRWPFGLPSQPQCRFEEFPFLCCSLPVPDRVGQTLLQQLAVLLTQRPRSGAQLVQALVHTRPPPAPYRPFRSPPEGCVTTDSIGRAYARSTHTSNAVSTIIIPMASFMVIGRRSCPIRAKPASPLKMQ